MDEGEKSNLPRHVGLIMDGNGRWAEKRLLPRSAGHAEGMNRMIALAQKAKDMGVRYFTVYALSTENLHRPEDEVNKLYGLIKKYFMKNVKKLIAQGASVKVIGDLSLLPEDVRSVVEEGCSQCKDDTDFTFIIALAYGSRNEIVRATNLAIKEGEEVDDKKFSSYLYTDGIPDVDFIIRTGGEMRLSNFLLWQSAYAELYFTDVLFPDFTPLKFEKALGVYAQRVRRFGKL
ncbi:MAG: polyprenyl diphosphate synthase [Candidatus Coproplasma sp.]